jgi:hypothetical protein
VKKTATTLLKRNPWFSNSLSLGCCDSGASDLEIYGLDYLSIAPHRATLLASGQLVASGLQPPSTTSHKAA